MKNASLLLLFLLISLGVVVFRDSHTPSTIGQTEAFSENLTSPSPTMAQTPGQNQATTVTPEAEAKPFPCPSPGTAQFYDEEQLKGQIKAQKASTLDPIDRQTELAKAQIASLQSQLQETLGAQSTMQQTAGTMLQVQEGINQQTIAQTNAQIRNAEERIQVDQQTLYRLLYDFDPGIVQEQRDQLNLEIAQLQAQKQALTTDLVDLNAQGSANVSSIGDQVATAQGQYAGERAAISAQISSLQDELSRLAQSREDGVQAIQYYQSELREVQKR